MCSGLSMQLCIFEDNGPLPKGECEYSKVECRRHQKFSWLKVRRGLSSLWGNLELRESTRARTDFKLGTSDDHKFE